MAFIDTLADGTKFLRSNWYIEDVKNVDSDLTDAECLAVLEIVADNFDANIGVNWDAIEAAVNVFKRGF